MKKFLAIVSLALCAMAVLVPRTSAAPTAVSYANGDLFLSFRASSGTGASQDYVVNIGQASNYTATGVAFAVPNLGNIGTDLAAVFGSDWATRSDVFWGISGTTGSFAAVGSDPAKTLYISKPQATAGTPGAAWYRGSDNAQGITTSKMNGFATAYKGKTSTANSSVAIIQNTTDANSYASYQKGGTIPNSGPAPGISFATFNPTNEGNFGSNKEGSVLDLNRLVVDSSGTGTVAGEILGQFTFYKDADTLVYTPTAAVGRSTVALSASTYSVLDNAGTATITLQRSGDPTTAFTVELSTANGTAIAGTDYTTQTATSVSFAINQSQATVAVPITQTVGFQNDRTFTVSIANASGASLGATTSATVTIADGDSNTKGTIAFSAATYNVSSLNTSGANNSVAVTLTRSGGTTGAVTVDVTATGGTLVNGTDYVSYASPTTVSFAAGASSATTTIQLNTLSSAGTIILGLTNATGGSNIGSQSAATINVALSPGYISYSAATYLKVRGTGSDVTLTITATRTAGSTGAVTAEVSVDGASTATAGSSADYTLPSSPVTLSWGNGVSTSQTFDITIRSTASVAAAGDTIILGFTNLTGSALTGTIPSATVKIVDPNTTKPTLTMTSPAEGATITAASVTLSGAATDDTGVSAVAVYVNNSAVQNATLTGSGTSVTWSLAGVVPQQGTNVIRVISYDAQNNPSGVLRRSFSFFNLRPDLAGNYNGLLTATVDGSGADHNGLVSIIVTSAGSFTGKLSLSGVVLPISGIFENNGNATFDPEKTASVELLKKNSAGVVESLGVLELSITTASVNVITGTIKDFSDTITYANISADQALYAKVAKGNFVTVPTTVRNPATDKGVYTCIFPSSNATNNGVAISAFPQGDGFGTITISDAGVATLKGTLADGTVIPTYSKPLSQNNEFPIYIPLYKGKGFIFGNVAFDSLQTSTDATCTGMLWFRPSGVTAPKVYLAGWPDGITTDFAASKFVPTSVATTKTVLGKVPGTFTITAADGGLTSSRIDAGSLNLLNKVTLTTPTNATALTLTFVPGTGAFSGSFKHQVAPNAVVKFNGVVFQKTNTGAGFFLYLPTGAPTGASSGSVGVSTP